MKYELEVDYSIAPTLHLRSNSSDFKIIHHPKRQDKRIIDLSRIRFIRAHDDPYPAGGEPGGGQAVRSGLRIVSLFLLVDLLDLRVMEEILNHPEAIPPNWRTQTNSKFTNWKRSDSLGVADFHGTTLVRKDEEGLWIPSLVGFGEEDISWDWDLSSLESRHWHWTSFGACYPRFKHFNLLNHWPNRWPE